MKSDQYFKQFNRWRKSPVSDTITQQLKNLKESFSTENVYPKANYFQGKEYYKLQCPAIFHSHVMDDGSSLDVNMHLSG